MFTKKGLIYFSKTHLLIYTRDLALPLRIEFEEDTIVNLETVNINWLKQKVKEEVNKSKINNLNTMLILSKDIVFDKIIDSEEPESKEKEIKEFLLEVPFKPELIKDKEFVKDENVLITATNRHLYKIIIDILEEVGITVSYVLPEIVFYKVEFSKTFLKEVFKQKDLLEHGNFLDEKPRNSIDMKSIYMVLGIIIIIAAIVGLILFLKNNKKGVQPVETPQTIQEESKTEEMMEEVVEIEEKPLIEKENITVNIYNGTGTPGFAGQISDTVESIGYTNITASNADNFDYTATIIEKSSNIPTKQIDEIKDVLSNYLESFEIIELENSEDTINIITGKKLTE